MICLFQIRATLRVICQAAHGSLYRIWIAYNLNRGVYFLKKFTEVLVDTTNKNKQVYIQ